MRLPRQAGITAALALLGSMAVSGFVLAEPRHGASAFGKLKYAADFKHFDYVNPDAPKGGRLSMIGNEPLITFDSFNGFIARGVRAQGLIYLYDTLLARAMDEPDAAYGLLAKTVERSADGRSATFVLRKEARFANGTPVRASDVVWSFEKLTSKVARPAFSAALQNIEKAEALDDLTVRFTAKEGAETRDLPLRAGAMPVLWRGNYAERDFSKPTLTPPVSSGPYEITDFKQGRYVTYSRREDYWARDLPVNRGRFNFDELRYEFFRDRNAELEGLKSRNFELREEFTSRTWARQYDIPQVADGRMIKEELPDESASGGQGFLINTRRAKFADPRIREALGYAFDFEWTRRTLFFGAYERTASYFENSNMRAAGKPSPAELALLEPFRDQLSSRVFGPAIEPPVSNGSGKDKKLLRTARKMLLDAGMQFKNGEAFLADGTPFDVEFLIFAQGFERIISPFVENLRLIGVPARISRIPPTAYEQRRISFDFDIIVRRYAVPPTPGPELANFFRSVAADTPGSFNFAGIKDPVVDALLAKVQAARSRQDLVSATRALDRVLRAGFYWIPNWYNRTHRLAYWNVFQRPAVKPKYARGIIDTWWYDEAKAAKLAN
ncbi:MAG: extracellular solute-binding protein [Pseudomonadota bacterium]